MQHTPSAVYHYDDAGGGGNVQHNKVNAIFQAAKKDLLRIIQIEVVHKLYCSAHHIHLLKIFIPFYTWKNVTATVKYYKRSVKYTTNNYSLFW